MDERRLKDQWWFRHFGQQWGPVPFEMLASMARNGTLAADDDVRSVDGDWRRADELPGLFSEVGDETPAGLERWWYRTPAGTFGPVTTAELAALAERGELSPDDSVRLGEASEWLVARQFDMLFRGDANAARRGEATPNKKRSPKRAGQRGQADVASAADGAAEALQRALGLRPGATLNAPRRPPPRRPAPIGEQRKSEEATSEGSAQENSAVSTSRSTAELPDDLFTTSKGTAPQVVQTADEPADPTTSDEDARQGKRSGILEVAVVVGALALVMQLYPPLWQRLFAVIDVRAWTLSHYLVANIVFVGLLVVYWVIDRNLSQGGSFMRRKSRHSKTKGVKA